jgi:CBS domain-containing protein
MDKKGMNVGSICNRNVVSISQDADLLTAAELMREEHVGSLLIVVTRQHKVRPVGILTDRDLMLEIVAEDIKPTDILVKDLMTREVICVREDDDIMGAIKTMYMESVRRMPVINDAGNLIGIVTMDDLIEILANELSNLIEVVGRQQRYERKEIHSV